MDTWGIIIFVVGGLGYFLTRRRYPVWLFVAGTGAGIIIGAIWSYLIVTGAIDTLVP